MCGYSEFSIWFMVEIVEIFLEKEKEETDMKVGQHVLPCSYCATSHYITYHFTIVKCSTDYF